MGLIGSIGFRGTIGSRGMISDSIGLITEGNTEVTMGSSVAMVVMVAIGSIELTVVIV